MTRYGDLTYEEIRDRAAQGWLVIVPLGCTEQQGPHLTVDFDTWLATEVCAAAATRAAEKYGVKGLVLPTLPFGPTPEHRGHGSGYIHLPQGIHEAVISSILNSLSEQGFQRIVTWRGCGQHDVDKAVEHFNQTHCGRSRAFRPEWPYKEAWCRVGDPTIPGGHADSFATSIALYLRPGSVRLERISNPRNGPVDWDDPQLDFSRYSSSGVIGDPTHADAKLGERLWRIIVDEVAVILKEVSETDTLIS